SAPSQSFMVGNLGCAAVGRVGAGIPLVAGAAGLLQPLQPHKPAAAANSHAIRHAFMKSDCENSSPFSTQFEIQTLMNHLFRYIRYATRYNRTTYINAQRKDANL